MPQRPGASGIKAALWWGSAYLQAQTCDSRERERALAMRHRHPGPGTLAAHSDNGTLELHTSSRILITRKRHRRGRGSNLIMCE